MDKHYHLVLIKAYRLVIVAFGIAGTVFMAINNLLAAKFFMLFSPIFMVYRRDNTASSE